ncbi:MAG: hypothetical protein ACREON_18930, partial [Gemmatimonadaceae bacterium]
MSARLEIGRLTLAIALGLAAAPASLFAQDRDRDRDRDSESWLDDCRDRDWDDRDMYCEIKEHRLQPSGSALVVDGRQNGGITVRGWDQREILVRARIQTWAGSEERARELASEVKVEANGGRLSATGPSSGRRSSWAVSYEIFVPRRYDLDLETYNGGIRVSDVHGRLDLSAHNGG